MDLSTAILGQSIVTALTERQRAAVLRIGRDTFDRGALAGVACFNFTAAAILTKIINTEIQVTDTRDLFDRIHPDRVAIPGLGAVSLAVLGAAFQAKKIGGASPLENWFRKHRGGTVTFSTLKHADHAERKKAAQQDRARRRARGNVRRRAPLSPAGA